jgi:hypothetical protein
MMSLATSVGFDGHQGETDRDNAYPETRCADPDDEQDRAN